MDRFFDRLGTIIKGFLDDDDERTFRSSDRPSSNRDPDLEAAYDELDDFLKVGKSGDGRGGRSWSDPLKGGHADRSGGPRAPAVPEALKPDFLELNVPFGSDLAACKASYKRLLNIHHPDRHAGHPGNMKKATDKSARINASFRRIEQWRETGRLD